MTSAFGRAKILLGEAVKEDQAGNAEEALKWYKQVCLQLWHFICWLGDVQN